VTVRVNPVAKKHLETLELHRDVNEWQFDGIVQALAEAEKQDAVFVDHDEVLAGWEAKKVCLECASVGAPTAETAAAIRELEEGKGKSFLSVDELLADLNADE